MTSPRSKRRDNEEAKVPPRGSVTPAHAVSAVDLTEKHARTSRKQRAGSKEQQGTIAGPAAAAIWAKVWLEPKWLRTVTTDADADEDVIMMNDDDDDDDGWR